MLEPRCFHGLDEPVSETAATPGAVRHCGAHRFVERRGRDLNPRGACRRLAIVETAAHEQPDRPRIASPYLLQAPQRATRAESVPKTCPQVERSSDAVFVNAAFCRCFLISAAIQRSLIPSLSRRCSTVSVAPTKKPLFAAASFFQESPLGDSNPGPPPYHPGTKDGSAGTSGSQRPRKPRTP